MKKILVTIALTAVCAGAFAQGKITMGGNASHLIYFGSNVKNGDVALTAIPASSALFLVDLYGGANASSMTLQTTAPINAAATGGGFGNINFTSPNLAGGVNATFQIQVREVGFATAAEAQLGGGYFGLGQIFTMTPSSSIAFNSIVNAGGTALSTWANGTQVLAGGFGAVAVNVVPEPSSMALAGLGAASLLMFRRRK